MVYVCFFFFKQKTAYEMRISDWSSDVCSSDLQQQRHVGPKKQVEEKKAGHRQHPRPRLRRQPWSSVLPALMAFRLRRYSRLRLAILLKCASASIERSKYDSAAGRSPRSSAPKPILLKARPPLLRLPPHRGTGQA